MKTFLFISFICMLWSLPTSAQRYQNYSGSVPSGISDPGYSDLPRFLCDVNGDGRKDYGRFVGDGNQRFLSFAIKQSNGSFEEYGYNSEKGLDMGYRNTDLPDPWMEDVNGDGRLDYCRYVGDRPDRRKAACLGKSRGFSSEPYFWFEFEAYTGSIPAGIQDHGYSDSPRFLCDVNDDGYLDFGRFVGNHGERFLSFALKQSNGSYQEYGYNSVKGFDRGYFQGSYPNPVMKDVNGDGKLDYVRYVGDAPNVREAACLGSSGGFSDQQYSWQ